MWGKSVAIGLICAQAGAQSGAGEEADGHDAWSAAGYIENATAPVMSSGAIIVRHWRSGLRQTKFAASSMLPVPTYRAS